MTMIDISNLSPRQLLELNAIPLLNTKKGL